MKHPLTLCLLMAVIFTLNAQSKKENIEALNKLFAHKFYYYALSQRATDEGLYFFNVSEEDLIEKDAKGSFPLSFEFLKWSDMETATIKTNTSNNTRYLWLGGPSKEYMRDADKNDIQFDGRSYAFYKKHEGISIFGVDSAEVNRLNAIAMLINIIRKQ